MRIKQLIFNCLFFILGFGNDLVVHNQEKLFRYLEDEGQSRGSPLLTYCNHSSMLDDPALVCKKLLTPTPSFTLI